MSGAKSLYAAGAVALALVPPAMALANRSSPLVVAIAALLFTAGVFSEFGRGALPIVLRPLGSALGLAVLGFLAWCLLSFAWSPFPALSLRTLAEFGPTLVAAYLLARLAPGRLPACSSSRASGSAWPRSAGSGSATRCSCSTGRS